MASNKDEISEGVYNLDLWNRLDIHLGSYIKSPIQLRYVSTKTPLIGRVLRRAVIDLLDKVIKNSNEYIENETTVIGTEHRLYHARRYLSSEIDNNISYSGLNINNDDKIDFEITSFAPTVFYQLREDIGISNERFRESFLENNLKDFTNPGKSGSLMFKTYDDLFILKTLRDYEARLLLQILPGYHLQLRQRSTLFNRYIGVYSMRLQTSLSTFDINIAIMANAFTPSLKVHEIFDLKGSTIKRKLSGNLSTENLYKLKDMDFKELYPDGIRIPTNIYKKLKSTIANDVKVLKKLNITDFSLILGIRHLDMTDLQMVERGQKKGGLGSLIFMSHNFLPVKKSRSSIDLSSLDFENDTSSLPVSYLKPLKMLNETTNTQLYYNDDNGAFQSLPIPGIINKTNQRVYMYLAIVDILQTFDSFKLLDQTYRKITNYDKRREYSVIEPNEYEKRINQFLFDQIFIDANDDFPWMITNMSKSVVDMDNKPIENKTTDQYKIPIRTRPRSIERENSINVLEFRF